MARVIPALISSTDHPAVRLAPDGRVLAANPQGEHLLTSQAAELAHLLPYFPLGQTFKRTWGTEWLIQASPFHDEASTGFEITWYSIASAEARLWLLQDVSKAVNSSLILEDIFDSLGDVLQTYVPFESGCLVILDESQNSTKVVVTFDALGHAAIRGDNNLFVGYDPLMNQLLKKPISQHRFPPYEDSLLLYPQSENAIIVPLISKGVVIGSIGLSGKPYSAVQLNLLEEVSEQLAVAIENARLYWQTQSQAGREFLINTITKSIRQSLDMHRILETTVLEIGKVMGLSRCLIHYWGKGNNDVAHFEYVLPGVAPISNLTELAELERDLFLKRSDPSGQYNPFILNDCRNDAPALALLARESLKSFAVFPILLEEETFVGTISLHQCDAFRAWVTEDIELLQAIAEHVSVAVNQALLFQEKENQRQDLEKALNELQQAQMQLIQTEKMAVLGQFVAGIAHEVNTPLGTMMANDDTVKKCIELLNTEGDKEAKYKASALELLKINRMASERIEEIVRNLRNFARLDDKEKRLFDIHEGLDSTLLLVSTALKEKKITVVKQYGELPWVICFPGLLNQVFMNLLVNASHSIETTGTITITTRYEAASNEIQVAIADTGKGILPAHLPRIFDPGFTTKGVGVGTGLGLALCYKMMEKHHGRIEVDSVVGQGTVMTVCLPVQSA